MIVRAQGQPIPEVGDLSKNEPFHEVGGPHPLSLIHDVPEPPRCKENGGHVQVSQRQISECQKTHKRRVAKYGLCILA